MKIVPVIASLGLIPIVLSGCSKPWAADAVSRSAEYVVGPDLDPVGPFAGAGNVHIGAPTTNGSSASSSASDDLPYLDITPNAAGDTGRLAKIVASTDKPFDAGVTYYRFTPVVAETNAEAHAYWLVGLNLSRTPDRSAYIVLRYPARLAIQPGLSSDAFEYAALTCADLDVARRPAVSFAPAKEGAPQAPDTPPDPKPEAGDCEFNSRAEMATLTPLILKRYDQIKHYDDAPALAWQPVHVDVK